MMKIVASLLIAALVVGCGNDSKSIKSSSDSAKNIQPLTQRPLQSLNAASPTTIVPETITRLGSGNNTFTSPTSGGGNGQGQDQAQQNQDQISNPPPYDPLSGNNTNGEKPNFLKSHLGTIAMVGGGVLGVGLIYNMLKNRAGKVPGGSLFSAPSGGPLGGLSAMLTNLANNKHERGLLRDKIGLEEKKLDHERKLAELIKEDNKGKKEGAAAEVEPKPTPSSDEQPMTETPAVVSESEPQPVVPVASDAALVASLPDLTDLTEQSTIAPSPAVPTCAEENAKLRSQLEAALNATAVSKTSMNFTNGAQPSQGAAAKPAAKTKAPADKCAGFSGNPAKFQACNNYYNDTKRDGKRRYEDNPDGWGKKYDQLCKQNNWKQGCTAAPAPVNGWSEDKQAKWEAYSAKNPGKDPAAWGQRYDASHEKMTKPWNSEKKVQEAYQRYIERWHARNPNPQGSEPKKAAEWYERVYLPRNPK